MHQGALESPDSYYMTVSTRSLHKPEIKLLWNWFGQHGLHPFNSLLADAPKPTG